MGTVISFAGDDSINYQFVNWQELGEIAEDLARQILASNIHFDRIIALATGGHTASRALKDYLAVRKLSSLQISFYENIGKTKKAPVIRESLATEVSGEKLLVFDDVNDSGATMETATKYLSMCGATSITTAVLFTKPVTHHPCDFAGRTTSDWVVFPDEIRETIELLSHKWDKKGISKIEINQRLISIGFTQSQIDLVQKNRL